MRTALALAIPVAMIVLLWLALRPSGTPPFDVVAEGGGDSGADGDRIPCTAFSEEEEVDGAAARWSYRLCGRGAVDRRVELRFRGDAAYAGSIEYRVWLEEPADCEAPAFAGPDSVAMRAQEAAAPPALAVPFEAYRGELWLCARGASAAHAQAWSPRRLHHGSAI